MTETIDATTSDVPAGHEDARSRTYPCPGCGADLTFNIGVQQLKCDHCGYEQSLEIDPDEKVLEQDFNAMLDRLAALRQEGAGTTDAGFSEVECKTCGATVRFTGSLTSTECAYCGVPLQRENVHEAKHRIPVDGVLSFRIDRKAAQSNLREWVQSRWFAPNDFKKRGVQGKFTGLYLPYWTFDSFTTNAYSGMRGDHYTVTVGSGKNRRTEVRTRWTPASGRFQRFFDDVLVVAAMGLPKKRLTDLEPWPLNACTPFNQDVLSGFVARTYDVPLGVGFVDAKSRMDKAIEAEVRKRIGGDVQQVHSIQTSHAAVTFKHLLLPVWMMGYTYKEKPHQVVVNAATGEVQGDRPYSWIKITLAAVAALAAVGTTVYLAMS